MIKGPDPLGRAGADSGHPPRLPLTFQGVVSSAGDAAPGSRPALCTPPQAGVSLASCSLLYLRAGLEHRAGRSLARAWGACL